MMRNGFSKKGDMSDDRKSMIHLCDTCKFIPSVCGSDQYADAGEDLLTECQMYEEKEE